MPQTCYSPRYGCYPGNSRYIHRYPAFHGAYYRRPYNYRNAFDYPWHAEMHEPTSLFSYNTYDPALESIEMGENYSQVLPGGEPEMFVPLGHDSRIKRVRSEPPSVRPLGK